MHFIAKTEGTKLKRLLSIFKKIVKRKRKITTHLTVHQEAGWRQIGDVTKRGNNSISLQSKTVITNKSTLLFAHHTDT